MVKNKKTNIQKIDIHIKKISKNLVKENSSYAQTKMTLKNLIKRRKKTHLVMVCGLFYLRITLHIVVNRKQTRSFFIIFLIDVT